MVEISSDQLALESLLLDICQTPSPTFAEQARAALIKQLFEGAGFASEQDDTGNVIAELPGGTGPRVLLAAHLDTVFPLETDVTVKRAEARWMAPGLGDNSASLAVLVHYLQNLPAKRPRLTVAATVGEEGVGNLYGMRELMRVQKLRADKVIAVDGHLGTIVDQSVGSRRFSITVKAKGGHSWGDYPSPSATHALGDMIHNLSRLSVPREPRSSLNIGQVSGGTSINAIAQEASFNLDLRSLDEGVLAGLEREARNRILKVSRQHEVQADIELIGDRPAGKGPNDALVHTAKEVLRELEIFPRTAASSTDANIPMSQGIPAIAFGVYTGGDAHRLSEWLEPASLLKGYRALVLLLERLADS